MTAIEPIQKLLITVLPMVMLHFRQQGAEHHAAGEDADRDFRQDEGDDRHDRQHVARLGGEAAFEELRHGEHQRAHVERHEHPGQHQQAPGVQFIMGHRHAVLGAGTGQADDVLGADVRGEDRGADDPPAEVAAGEEVVGGGVLVLARPPTRRRQAGGRNRGRWPPSRGRPCGC